MSTRPAPAPRRPKARGGADRNGRNWRPTPSPDTGPAQLAGGARDTAPGIAQEAAKRILDIMLSLTALIVIAPVLLLLCLVVRLTSPGPALFRQERLGRDKQPFTLLKLRTMTAGNDDRIHREYVTEMLSGNGAAPAGHNGMFKLHADPRVTVVGKWLRRASLDELPQLINVLRGEMSLVGPRPVLSWEAQLFGEPYQDRFAVKPGMTGLWQVSGRSRLSFQEALELDLEYVFRHSFLVDLLILVRTVPAVLGGGAL
jgi:lipopolysaccharide/colanic/teichoic acid biosynthesis glycosyltransferase